MQKLIPCDQPEGTVHYWDLSLVRIDGTPYTRHTCKRCGATKDVIIQYNTSHSYWTGPSTKKRPPSTPS